MAVRDALTGRTLGEFVLRERIGEGGFGAVYRCEQPLLGREAVIKVLHTSLRHSEVVLQRFTREAQLASRLDHPYAAHIYAFGVEKDDGLCWIAMELVQGTTLDRWLRDRGPLPLAQLVPFFERVAEVVQTAHEGGIVHRDLKPSNIMVIERAGKLLPKLLDFGIAKMVAGKAPQRPTPPPRARTPSVVGDEATVLPVGAVAAPPAAEPAIVSPSASTMADAALAAPRPKASEVMTLPPDASAPWTDSSGSGNAAPLTKDDATMGSPPYMSPEQWADATRVGPSSDLYALGVVAYEALLGRRPFVASTITALASMHCHDPVPPVGDGFPASFDRFFARALAKLPEDRPATALELAATLRVAAGIGSAPEDLPRLDEAIRDAWLAEAPQNLAEGVAELDGARNVHQAREAARDLFRGLLRYLVAVALAARAQIRGEHDDPAVRDLLRGLRNRELDEDERIKLLRLLVRPFGDRRGAYPVPELVDFVGKAGDGQRDAIETMLQLRPSTDHVGTEDIVRSQLVQFIPALAKVMRAAAFVLEYTLVIPRDGVAERWMGMRRQRRTIAFARDVELVADQAVLLDRDGRRAVLLWPLIQAVAPTAATERESFVFDGRGRLGARLTAAPAGYEHHDPAVWDWFAEHVLGEVEGEAEKREDDRPPYLGLASFAAADADRFVGREREIDTFVNRLRRQALQVVVGPSGAGKSSFVHAGVVPGLPAGWRVVTLRPGMAPLTALATRLAAAQISTTDLRPVLEAAPAAAATIIAHAAGDGAIVIVVDQLEELFTLCGSAVERDQFAAALAHLAANADGATRVICTVRDDFLMQVESLAPLRAALSPSLFLIGNPSRDDLIRTIVEPARRIGYELSDTELASEMVDVVADRPGALALLSFTASRLWELRDRRFKQLTRKAYDSMGGVAGALGQHAETTFLSLVPDEQRVAREAFRFLVTADMTRAVMMAGELRQRLHSSRSDAVIGKLVDARLLAVVEGETESTVEIIHEALIAAWPRLQQWTREDTADSRSREQIRIAAKQWADRDRPRELLWRGDLLLDLKRWRERITLTELEAAFADASRADAARGTRIRRAIVTVAIAITAVFVAMLVWANSNAQRANRENAQLLRESTFDQGRVRMVQGDKLGALPFLARAYAMGETGAANRLMIEEALRPTRARVRSLEGHTDKLWQVAYSPDGKRLATASLDGTARVWDADTGAQVAVIPADGAVLVVAFSADGTQLAVGGRGTSVRLWDLVGNAQIASLPVESRVTTLAFGPNDASLLAVGDSAMHLWRLPDHATVSVAGAEDVAGAAFSADGSRLGEWHEDGVVIVRDGRTFQEILRAQVADGVTCGAIDRAGTSVAVGTSTGEIDLVHEGAPPVLHPNAHRKPLTQLAFSPDSATFASASDDGSAILWTADGAPRATLAGHSAAVNSLAFSHDGELVVTASSDGTARLWTASTGTPRGEVAGGTSPIVSAAFRPGDHDIVTAAWDHRATIWNARAAQQFRAVPTARVNTTRASSSIKYRPDGGALAILGDDNSVTVFSAGAVVCADHGSGVTDDLTWSPDGRVIALQPAQGTRVRILDARTCAPVREIDQGDPLTALAFVGPDQLATGGPANVKLWNVATGELVTTLRDYPGAVVGLELQQDHWLVAINHREGERSSVILQELVEPKRRHVFVGGFPGLTAVEIDPVRHLVLASSYDQHVWIWNEETGELVDKLEGSGPLFGERTSADGATLVGIGGNSPTVWSLSDRAKIGVMQGHNGLVVRGEFLADGLFMTSGRDGSARVWDLSTLRPLLSFGGAVVFDVDPTRTHVVLSDVGGAREWSPSFPAPDRDELARVLPEGER